MLVQGCRAEEEEDEAQTAKSSAKLRAAKLLAESNITTMSSSSSSSGLTINQCCGVASFFSTLTPVQPTLTENLESNCVYVCVELECKIIILAAQLASISTNSRVVRRRRRHSFHRQQSLHDVRTSPEYKMRNLPYYFSSSNFQFEFVIVHARVEI